MGRLGAVLTAFCVLVHLAMAHTAALHGSLIPTAFATGMAALCLPCAGRLWHDPDTRTWRMTALMAAVMLAAQPLMGAGHAHGPAGTVAAVALLLVALLHRPGQQPGQARPPWRLRHDES
ncbi:hypothetical protein BJ973_000697 [Actinoplanes tereljensis]|uniref:Uncharacterized protein n=1 Tax=Paractinoplanes tereljensis TaxID=571912 RepID=A0A919NQ21_9ACTN|nr:hypothetical protein [Actinoplanes tereljensis]GIF22945.1 hypothetical protein Ate02nite_56750 [Actinoplanes tereljensis]